MCVCVCVCVCVSVTTASCVQATQTVTWMCFDGPLKPLWTHYLTELAGRSKVRVNGSLPPQKGRQLAGY